MAEVRTILVDSNKLFRQGLKSLISGTSFKVVNEVSHLSELDALQADTDTLDLILIDLSGDMDRTLEDIRDVRKKFPKTKLVILTSDMSADNLATCFASGIDGYLLKDISCDALVESLRLVLLGEKVFPTYLANLLVGGASQITGPSRQKLEKHKLSDREVEILECLVEGNSNKMIANKLLITEATVKVHLKSILRKIDARNRTQAAIWALSQGFAQSQDTGTQAASEQESF